MFCVLEPRETYRDTGPIAAVVVDCADPRALARFWGAAMGWTLHEVSDDHARLRAAKGVGPIWSSSARPTRRPGGTASISTWCRTPVTTTWRRSPGCRPSARHPPTSARAMSAWIVLADPEGDEFCVLAPADTR